jgi:catechol 2,3-dioxygenase-like lactoylglutathione lyase family enzyme
MKIHRLDHIHVYCLDPDASRRFYTEVFEAKMLGRAYGSDGGVRYFLRLGGLALVLAPYPQGTEPGVPTVYRDGIYEHGYGVGHFGLHVENVDEARRIRSSARRQDPRRAKGVCRRSLCIRWRVGQSDN